MNPDSAKMHNNLGATLESLEELQNAERAIGVQLKYLQTLAVRTET
jgi:Flp pilus assembly protein TadD